MSNSVFKGMGDVEHEFNVLQAAVFGLIQIAEVEPQSMGDQIVCGVQNQLDRTDKAIRAMFKKSREQ